MGVPTIYIYSDTGAPVLFNGVGEGTALLDAIIVTGYPTQSITSLTHSAGTITGNKTSHGYTPGDVITISGAVEDEYNGRVTVLTTPNSNDFTYAPVGSNPSSSPATGTILASTSSGKAGLGWQLVYTGTDKRVYRPRFGSRPYIRADNNTQKYEIAITGYTTMSDVDTGTEAFGPVYWKLTNNVASANRNWFCYGDEKRLLYLGDPSAAHTTRDPNYMGDFQSYKAGDAYNFVLIGRSATSSDAAAALFARLAHDPASSIAGHFIWKSYTQSGSGVAAGKGGDANRHSNTEMGLGSPGSNTMTYPHPIDGTIHLSRLFLRESAGLRGHIQGLWNVCHNLASMTGAKDQDTFSGGTGLTGRNFIFRSISAGGLQTITSCMAIESTDWDA